MSIPKHTLQLLTARSGGRCEIRLKGCQKKGVDPHHVKSKARGGSDDLLNLFFVCRNCHNAIGGHKPGTKKYRTFSWQTEGQTEEDWENYLTQDS